MSAPGFLLLLISAMMGCAAPQMDEDFKQELEKIRAHIPPGKIVKYSCRREYTPDLKPHVKCNWWYADQETAKQCGRPPAILFGEVVGGVKTKYQPGETVEYKCPNEYVIKGNNIIKCVEDIWEEAPSCLGPCTTDEKDMEENNVELKWKNAKEVISGHGKPVEFRCKQGYVAPPGTKMRVVCDHEKLDIPKCLKAEPCITTENDMKENNIRPKWSNMTMLKGEHGQKAEFICLPGYKAPPNTKMRITCNQGKMDFPKCVKEKPCITTENDMKENNIRPKWSNMTMLKGEHGQKAEFICLPGYKAPPNTKMRITCNQGKMDFPKCVKEK